MDRFLTRRDMRRLQKKPAISNLLQVVRQIDLWVLIFPSFVGFWLLGAGMLWIACVPLAVWVFSNRWKTRREFDAGDLLIIVSALLAVRLLIAFVLGDTQPGRTVGAAFSVFSWAGAWAVYRISKDGTSRRRSSLLRGFLFFLAVQGILILIAVTLHPSPLNYLVLPVSQIFESSTIGRWATPTLASLDWFGDVQMMRSNGMMGASAWSGGFGALGVILTVCGWKCLRQLQIGRTLLITAFVGSAAAVVFSLSRTSYAITLLTVGIAAVFFLSHVIFRRYSKLIATAFLICSSIIMFFALDIPEIISRQDALRPGSSEARFASYAEGITAVLHSGPLATMFGLGFKPYFEEQDRGIGSESTFISLLVRGGLLVVAIFVAYLVWRFVESVYLRDWAAVFVLPALAIHAISADLDAGTITVLFSALLMVPALAKDDRLDGATVQVPPYRR